MLIDGYVRVSHVGGRTGERFLSPSVQRDQIEAWARRTGAMLGEVFEELDESGARRDRPLLEQAICRVERGDSDGLVVAYMSRFGRSSLHGLMAIDRITQAGGTFVSVQEGLDLSTDIGRHMLRTMLSWAEWELDRMREDWAIHRQRAVARGLTLGRPAFGYRRGVDGVLEVDPDRAPIAVEIFRRRAEGARLGDLCKRLMERGVPTATGKSMWRASTLRSMLGSRAYLGETRHGDFVNAHAHPALVDEKTWTSAQFLDGRTAPLKSSQPALLGGLLRCAECCAVLRPSAIALHSSTGEVRYACTGRRRDTPCPVAVTVRDRIVEPYVEAVFFEHARRARRTTTARKLERLETALRQREQELNAYRDNPRLVTTLGPERFREGVAVRVRRVDRTRRDLSEASADRRAPIPKVSRLREQWPSMTIEQRRHVIAQVIDCVFVLPRQSRPEQRFFVCLRGNSPADVPPPARPKRFRTLDPANCVAPPAHPRVPEWSERKLERVLRPFLETFTRWPNFPEFQAVGLGAAYVQIEQHGGHLRWARRFGLPYGPPRGERDLWPDERIRSELRLYLRDRREWPDWDQFRRDGKGALREAITATGGPQRWAAEAGIDFRAGYNMRWSYPLLKQEVARLARGRRDWPAESEFQAAGMSAVYHSIRNRAIRPQLAADLGLELPNGRVNTRRWTDVRIEAALDRLLSGRHKWPTRREFHEAGLDGLYQTLLRNHTRNRWAQRYGLEAARSEASSRKPDHGRSAARVQRPQSV